MRTLEDIQQYFMQTKFGIFKDIFVYFNMESINKIVPRDLYITDVLRKLQKMDNDGLYLLGMIK